MQTQIACPQCRTTYMADVHQIIDVGQQPELKQMLLAGQLNVAVCPSCGAAGQMSTAMIYHDPAHELFMVYVPPELNLDQMQREQYIGQMTRRIMDATPAEKRRAYMFQPQQVLSMQSFMENVLETEGITKEMIARQQKQAELLNTLAKADQDVQDYLIKERSSEIDETFFAMLRQYVETAQQMNDNASLIPLLNLQAKLMTETAVGREIEKRQVALHRLSQDAKKEGGLTPLLLLRHVLLNQEDMQAVRTIVQAGIQAMNYEFFSGLTAEIEKQQLANQPQVVARLTKIRQELLDLQRDMQAQTQQVLQKAQGVLDTLLAANDLDAALRANANHIDDAFMYLLQAEMDQAAQNGDSTRYQALENINDTLLKQIEGSAPPEIQLINNLVRTESEAEQRRLLDENQDLLGPELLEVMDLLQDQVKNSGQPELGARLAALKAMIQVRV